MPAESNLGSHPIIDEAPDSSRTNHPTGRRRTNGRACINCHERKIRCDIIQNGAPCTNCSSNCRDGCRLFPKKRHREHALRRVREDPVSLRPYDLCKKLPITKSFEAVTPSSMEDDSASTMAAFLNRDTARSEELSHHTVVCFIGNGISNCNYLVQESPFSADHDGIFHFKYGEKDLNEMLDNYTQVPPEILQWPNKSLADRLVVAYFEHVNCGWPIVDPQRFMLLYEEKDPRFSAALGLINAVFLVGAHVLASKDKTLFALQPLFFRRAKYFVESQIREDRTMHMQVALLLTWYSNGQEEVLENAWDWVGFATRIAIGAGVHRDVTRSRMLPLYKRLWARLWWIMFQFDTIVSASLGRPQLINIDESDVPELEPGHFEGIPEARIDFVIQQTRLCKIISHTMKRRWALKSSCEARIRAVQEADQALAALSLQLPDSLQFSVIGLDHWKAILHLTYNNFVLLLHRPQPRRQQIGQLYEACTDLNACSAATTTISTILEALLSKGALTPLWFHSNSVLFTAMIYSFGELHSSNPLTAVRSQHVFDSLMMSLRELSIYWRYALEILRLFEQRISQMEKRKRTAHVSTGESESDRLAPANTTDMNEHDEQPHQSEDWGGKSTTSANPDLFHIEATQNGCSSGLFDPEDAEGGGSLGPVDEQAIWDNAYFFDACEHDFLLSNMDGNTLSR